MTASYKQKRKTLKKNVLNVGDTVLIKSEENVPCSQWRTGKINKVVIGKDA